MRRKPQTTRTTRTEEKDRKERVREGLRGRWLKKAIPEPEREQRLFRLFGAGVGFTSDVWYSDDMIINDEIRAIKDLIVANSDCEQVYLFGSYAYGTPTADSDYDFYVVLNDNSKNPMLVMQDLGWSYTQACLKVSWHKKIMSVDFLAGYRSRFKERSKDYPFEHTIAEKGVLLYDK
ncbi:hypothetical protein AGMMS49546_11850 [Spirochaetia bacterium]|nr:hypothetical protein AGMMS49546_11850 [Spirochaetia bacterium]